MFLLDTDILIWILRSKTEIIEKISALKEKSPLYISVISIAEIYKNIYPSELSNTELLLGQHIVFNVDQQVAKIAGLYWQEYIKKVKLLSLSDCLIAATANIHDVTLITLNVKHFPMRDIKVIKP